MSGWSWQRNHGVSESRHTIYPGAAAHYPNSAHCFMHLSCPGDCYIAACGILSKEEGGFSTIGEEHDAGDSAHRVMEFAKSILEASKQVSAR